MPHGTPPAGRAGGHETVAGMAGKIDRHDPPRDPAAPAYSIVIPVYRSAAILPTLVARLDAFFDAHPFTHEYVFVNDGSPDDSWQALTRLKSGRDDMIIIDLIRNYGQHSALFCGLQHARGDFVITMDDDLQNPPEELIHLIRKAQEGHDVVFGQFHQKMHGVMRSLGTKIVGWLNLKLFRKPPDLVLTNFRIIRREIVDAICDFGTNVPYIPGMVLMTGKTFANVPVAHHPRKEGQSNYTLRVIAKLVIRIVFNYSAFPLRLLCGIGVLMALVSMMLSVFYLARNLIRGTTVPGWTTLIVLLSFYQGLMLVILAALGEYIVRIVNDVSGPRAYRIRTKL